VNKLQIRLTIILLVFISFMISQNLYINNIEIDGLITVTEKQIYRNSGLYPSEEFIDLNYNNKYDIEESFIDKNGNGFYDKGTYLSKGDEINIAINNLWSYGVFSDVQIFISESNDDNISLIINLEELPIVNEIKFKGNRKIKNRMLSDIILLEKDKRVSNNDLAISIEKIKEEYFKKHLHNVELSYELENTDNNYSKNVIFNFEEGKKVFIQKINIEGNNKFSDRALKKLMKNTKDRRMLILKGKFQENNFEEDIKALYNFYNSKGYRDFRVIDKTVDYHEREIVINIDIEEGEMNYYNNFIFTGNSKFTDNELLESLGIKKGDLFNQQEFDFAIFNLNSKYYDEGHYFLENVYNVIPNNDNTLDIHFNIKENEITTVRKIIISGNTKTDDNVIRRELKIYPNDIFSSSNLRDSYGDVFRLNFFQNINPEILTFNDNREFVDINFNVLEKETGRANFSMGYNEEHGLTGGGGFEFANFRGKGQALSINYTRGLKQQSSYGSSNYNNNNDDYESFSISFREPSIYDSPNSIGISYAHTERGRGDGSYLLYDYESNRISLSFGRKFIAFIDNFRAGWSLAYRSTKYFGLRSELRKSFSDDIIGGSEANGYADRVGITLTQNITRDSRNHPEFPTMGSRTTITNVFSGGFLGGNENYHKHLFDFNWFSPLLEKITVFQNFTFGGLKEIGENQYLPYNSKFIMGGSGIPVGEMLRGYGDNSIFGYVSSSGGKIMLKHSTELRYLISSSPTIFLFLFGEAGNVWSDFDDFDLFELKRSLGAGFRIYMPMLGILGYDIGYGFDSISPNNDDPFGWEHHLIFGMPFN